MCGARACTHNYANGSEAGFPRFDRLSGFGEAAPNVWAAVFILPPPGLLQPPPMVHLEARDISGRVLLPCDEPIQASCEQPFELAHLIELRGQTTRRSCHQHGES